MICVACSKSLQKPVVKNCMKCSTKIYLSNQILCENCSDTERKCKCCLKFMNVFATTKGKFIGCGACGK